MAIKQHSEGNLGIGLEFKKGNPVGDLTDLATKIITLLEFFNFASEVSRLQYE
jgi:hypothetical protein